MKRQWLFVAAMLCVVIGITMGQTRHNHYRQSQGKRQAKYTEAQESKTFWQLTFDDPNAFFSLWVAGFTGLLAFSTIGLWAATLRHAGHMEQSLDAYRSAERAWMGLGSIEHHPFAGILVAETVNAGIMFQFRFVNSRRTPAIKARCFSACKVLARDDLSTPKFIRSGDSQNFAVIPPGITVSSMPQGLNDIDTRNVKERKIRVLVYGVVEYEDALFPSIPRITECCVEVRYQGEAVDVRTGRRDDRYSFTPIGPQNRAT
jgi:hypothetical protein